jgi:hypothetical protein
LYNNARFIGWGSDRDENSEKKNSRAILIVLLLIDREEDEANFGIFFVRNGRSGS